MKKAFVCACTFLFLSAAASAVAADGPADAPLAIQPRLIGTPVPEGTLLKPDGTTFDLAKAVTEKPTLLIFYRGAW